jgi:hypothetical protein
MTILNKIDRLTALVMALLMFVTSTGFAIDMHYCNGELKSFSLFGKAKSCHELQKDKKIDCPHHKALAAKAAKQELNKKDCCSNKTVFVQVEQDQQVQGVEMVVSKQLKQFVIAYVHVILLHNFNNHKEVIPAFAFYDPPNLRTDIPILHQSFLL